MKINNIIIFYRAFGKVGIFLYLILNYFFNSKNNNLKLKHGWKKVEDYNKLIGFDYYNFRKTKAKNINPITKKEKQELEQKENDLYPMS